MPIKKYTPSKKLFPYQRPVSKKVYDKLIKLGVVYLAAQERTGKSYMTLDIVRYMSKVSKKPFKAVVITTKKAISGWEQAVEFFGLQFEVQVFNSEKLTSKGKDRYLDNLRGCSLAIVDETHKYLTAVPKPTKKAAALKGALEGKLIIFCGATPFSQGKYQIYPQFNISSYSPVGNLNTYEKYFRHRHANVLGNGKRPVMRLAVGSVIDYKAVLDGLVLEDFKDYFVFLTREEAGLLEPSDIVHKVELKASTKKLIKQAINTEVVEVGDNSVWLDSTLKSIHTLHMIENGVLKLGEDNQDFILLDNDEKIKFIKDKWGDHDKMVIMYYYRAEEHKLKKCFKHARILQSVSFAEGVDLHEYSDLIIYSQSFSSSGYIQRRCRQVNKKRLEDIKVHFLTVDNGISEKVYETVSKQSKNFTASMVDIKETY